MNESNASGPFFGGRAAIYIGGIMVGALLLIVGFGGYGRSRLAVVETFVQRSALGDSVYFQVAGAGPGGGPAVDFNGQRYSPLNSERQEFADTRMIRIETDSHTGLSLYKPESPKKSGSGKKPETGTFLKSGPGEFIKVWAE